MAFFTPQIPPLHLPAPGFAIERTVMDWKVKADGTPFHKAKDVAAFANRLGGTLLIGAKEEDGHLDRYVGMDVADAGAVRTAFSNAVRDRCQPLPQFECEEYEHPDDSTKRIVAVNVWPSLLLIGVRIHAHKQTENYGGTSWVYPVRSGTDAVFLEPSQLAMYMMPEVRRVAVLLSRVPKGTRLLIRVTENGNEYSANLDEVLEDRNLVTLSGDDGRKIHNIPLDCVVTVYESFDATSKRTEWRMIVKYPR